MTRAIPFAVLIILLVVRALDPGPVEQLRLFAFDVYQQLSPRKPGQSDGLVRVIDIDDESLARLGQWPWPRSIMAQIVDRLAEFEAVALGFDVIFSEPDRLSPDQIANSLPDSPDREGILRVLRTMPDNDERLAEACARLPVVTAFAVTRSGAARQPAVKMSIGYGGENPARYLPTAPGAVASLAKIEEAAAGNGAVNWVPDPDQVVRRLPVFFNIDGQIYPTLFPELLRVAQGARGYMVRSVGASGERSFGGSGGIVAVRIGRATVPTDKNGQMLMHFRPMDESRYIPAWRVLEPDFDASELRGRIVLIGASAAGLHEIRATPLDPTVPGVEIHAQAIEQVIEGAFLYRPDFVDAIEMVFLVVLCGMAIIMIPRVGAMWGSLLGLAGIILGLGLAWTSFDRLGWIVDWLYPTGAFGIIFLTTVIMLYLRTEAQREHVRTAFGRYLSPVLVEQLAEHPEQLRLGGELREATILFSDIRGFTTLSERFDAEALTSFMNRYFTELTDVILDNRGTVDKFIGDAIMAFWNAPLEDEDHAAHACRAALGMQERLAALNVTLRKEGLIADDVRTGIGLNTDQVCVGNLGSDTRFDYSVLGDGVNFASRIEGQSKFYGVDIIIGDETRWRIPEFATIELDLIRVRGKSRPETIHALLGDEAVTGEAWFRSLSQEHAAFRRHYMAQRWDEARTAIEGAQQAADGRLDRLYAFFLQRIEELEASETGLTWDGVYDGR